MIESVNVINGTDRLLVFQLRDDSKDSRDSFRPCLRGKDMLEWSAGIFEIFIVLSAQDPDKTPTENDVSTNSL